MPLFLGEGESREHHDEWCSSPSRPDSVQRVGEVKKPRGKARGGKVKRTHRRRQWQHRQDFDSFYSFTQLFLLRLVHSWCPYVFLGRLVSANGWEGKIGDADAAWFEESGVEKPESRVKTRETPFRSWTPPKLPTRRIPVTPVTFGRLTEELRSLARHVSPT